MSADRHPWKIGLLTALALTGGSLILFLLFASDGDGAGTEPGTTVAIFSPMPTSFFSYALKHPLFHSNRLISFSQRLIL